MQVTASQRGRRLRLLHPTTQAHKPGTTTTPATGTPPQKPSETTPQPKPATTAPATKSPASPATPLHLSTPAASSPATAGLTDYKINGKDYEVEYDLDNRITKVDVNNTDVEYRYDALGRRVIRKEGSTTSATKRYTYSSKVFYVPKRVTHKKFLIELEKAYAEAEKQ